MEIKYDEKLDLKNYFSANLTNKFNTNFVLLSIIEYFGNSNCGHYTAKCRISENKWINFNDLSYEISKNGFRSENAMILLYKRFC